MGSIRPFLHPLRFRTTLGIEPKMSRSQNEPKICFDIFGWCLNHKYGLFWGPGLHFFGLNTAIFPNVTITYIPSKMLQTSKRLQKLVYGSIDNAWSLSLSQETPLKTIKCHSLTHSLSDKVTYWSVLEIYWLLDVIVCSYDCVDAYVRIMSGRCFSLFCVCMQNGITPFSFSSVGKRQTESSN